MAIDVRVNGIPWKEFKNVAHASRDLGCGHYNNGEFDLTPTEMAEHFLKVRSGDNLEEIQEMAKQYLADGIDSFHVEWIPEESW
jgi:hypothetical protein